MSLWYDEVFDNNARYGLKVTKTLFHARSEFQQIDIVDTVLFGKALALDGIYQTSVGDEHYYHEMLVQPAMTTAPQIKRVLVIGGGDGGSVREVLSHPQVERVTMVELDRMVVEACREHLSEIGTAWDDRRLDLRFEDGVAFLQQYKAEPYDVIIVDGPDPIGPAQGLFQSPFYASCRKQLSADGVLVVQSESPHIMADEFHRIVRALQEVFPSVMPYFGPVPIYASGGWSYTCASANADPLAIIEDRAQQMEARCRYYNREIHRAAFVLPNSLKQTLSR